MRLTRSRIVTNSAPMATWFTVCARRSPGGLDRYREEARKAILLKERVTRHQPKFDTDVLKANEYVQGVWKEALRTGSASAAARVVVKETELEGFLVKQGSVILLPVQLLHFNEAVFEDPLKIMPSRWMAGEDDEVRRQQLKKQNLHLRSFGGGIGLCSGRFVAEIEVINVVSTIIMMFDLEFVRPLEEFRFNPRSIGVMSPVEDPLVRLRRRHSDS